MIQSPVQTKEDWDRLVLTQINSDYVVKIFYFTPLNIKTCVSAIHHLGSSALLAAHMTVHKNYNKFRTYANS